MSLAICSRGFVDADSEQPLTDISNVRRACAQEDRVEQSEYYSKTNIAPIYCNRVMQPADLVRTGDDDPSDLHSPSYQAK